MTINTKEREKASMAELSQTISHLKSIQKVFLLQGKFDEYTALYIEMPYPISKKGLHLRPAGTYLQAFHKGSWDKISDKYKEILAYVDKQGLSLYGFAYETFHSLGHPPAARVFCKSA